MNGRARIAWNIRLLRAARGLTQESLANEAGVAAPYVSSIERGIANPTVEVLERLAKVLECDVGDLLAVPAPGQGPPKSLRAGRKPKR